MKTIHVFLFMSCYLLLISCAKEQAGSTEDFIDNWKFHLGDLSEAFNTEFDDSEWETINLPHDWSIEQGYTPKNTAASTGFTPGGIGWYRKSFKLSKEDINKHIAIEFDGVYNNSKVWINGHLLGERPYGYSSFSYVLNEFIHYDNTDNIIAVKVDHEAYVDSRWYTGSGIYRNVRLIKRDPLHIKKYGVQIVTPMVSKEQAKVIINATLENTGEKIENVNLKYSITQPDGELVNQKEQSINLLNSNVGEVEFIIEKPLLWDIGDPNLYTVKVEVSSEGKLRDVNNVNFGIRTFRFDADKGFSINGNNVKIKGVNLHHDAGCLGAAVPKDIWEYRIKKLSSIGVNAIRCSHNPHSPELLDVCDEQGILVMNEIFDEWDRPKGKNLVYIGDKAAPEDVFCTYPKVFNEWAEQDLKDWALRDFNHPSVIMLSIGNEIELSFPYYAETYDRANPGKDYYNDEANYDSEIIKREFDKLTGGTDTLTIIAEKLAKWVRDIDTTRPVTCGSHQPSVGLISGYANTVDVLGFNYRANEYDIAHKTYPDLKIIGSENWVSYNEWKSCLDRDFVAGVFIWTGFAYLGEAGPWPRKGLNISLFDFAGFKNPRGHFFECLWEEDPKVYMVTTPENKSEFSYNEKKGWEFNMQLTKPPVWDLLRLWEWYNVNPDWNYSDGEPVIVQTYTNCEEAELFLNGSSLGKQSLADFADDNIIKWLVPFKSGELKVIGYNNGNIADEYIINTNGSLAKIRIEANKMQLKADGSSSLVITAELIDENQNILTNQDEEIIFEVSGPIKNLGVDNGWEYNVSPHKINKIKTHHGKAIIILQSKIEIGEAMIYATCKDLKSNELSIAIQ
ncbi:sugar-binding domain-containing protein [Bacteroidota bacterium]